jgi:hypothetical protein
MSYEWDTLFLSFFVVHDNAAADARCMLMWYVLIGCCCVILAYVETYIKWSLVCHLSIVRYLLTTWNTERYYINS